MRAIVPPLFFPPTESCSNCLDCRPPRACTFTRHFHNKVGKCDACYASGATCSFRTPFSLPPPVRLARSCLRCRQDHRQPCERLSPYGSCRRCLLLECPCSFSPCAMGRRSDLPLCSTTVSPPSAPAHQINRLARQFASEISIISQLSSPSPSTIRCLRQALSSLSQPPLISFAPPLNPVNTESLSPGFLARDRTLLRLLISGTMACFTESDWDKFTASWAAVVAVYVPGFKATHLLLRHKAVFPKRVHDLDKIMSSRGCQGIIAHTCFFVVFSTFSSDVCRFLHHTFCSRLALSLHPNYLFESGCNNYSDSDPSQRGPNAIPSMKCANFGISSRRQLPNESPSRIVSGSRDVCVSLGRPERILSHHKRPYYFSHCLPIWDNKGLSARDRFYPGRTPRIAATSPSVAFRQHRLPYVRANSFCYLNSNNIDTAVASCHESQCLRRIAEEYLILFRPLPYGCFPEIALRNQREFFRRKGIPVVDRSYLRLLPNGTAGSKSKTKGIHDDGNGAFSPGIWQSVKEDPKNQVSLMFLTVSDSIVLRSTEKRFGWFDGLVPHTTIIPKGEVPSGTSHIHHSSYIKLEHEQLCLVVLDERNIDSVKVSASDRSTS